ncbi:MAG: hypothetical protein COV67_02075 [Nitrospinae bacterium CG11_big_fil_rev_8_21_14_0_20_56_8]|nr:MAG: hypothetical protein COV67_02075 [Nitrospinae bacterium CG11_big_fil_rev_8_21_14_0_20_56_8]
MGIYYHSFSRYGFNIWDEGGFANGTLRTLRGERAGSDFNPIGYLPGRYLYGALFFKWFGIDVQSLRLGVLVLTPGMVLLVYAAARKLMSPGPALLAALCAFSVPSMYYNRFYLIFCVANLFCLLHLVEKRRPAYLLILIGSILISGYFKFEVALFSTVIAIPVLLFVLFVPSWRNEFLGGMAGSARAAGFRFSRPVLWGGGGFMALVAAGLVLHIQNINLYEKGVQQVVEAYRLWGNPFPQVFPFFDLWAKLGGHKLFERILFYLPPAIYAAVGFMLAYRVTARRRDLNWTDLQALIVLAFGVAAFGLVIWRAGFDNLLRTLPPAYILLCFLLDRLRVRALALPGFQAGETTRMKRVGLNIAVTLIPFLYLLEMNTHHGFYAGSIGALRQETALLDLDRMKVYTDPGEARWIKGVVDRIETYTEPGDSIFVLPLNPIFYFLTDRVNPTPYDWILPGMLDEAEQKRVVEKLQANKPKLIIYIDIPIDGKEERRFYNYAPIVFRFIADNYLFDEYVGYFQILLPRDLFQK